MPPATTPTLFAPLRLRGLGLKNRILVSPMCQYSSEDGMPTPWHLVHLGSRAVGGAALVMMEATAVSPEGRISPNDMGIWSDAHAEAMRPIAAFVREQGAVAAIQIAHAGRKASTARPWEGGGAVPPGRGGWTPIAPSPLPFGDRSPVPHEMTPQEIERVVGDFAAATERACSAGFEVVEIHMAHGYLVHEFLSPLSNQRRDEHGGSLAGRMRLALRIARVVRDRWPADLPVFARISATDWVEGGWDLAQSIELARGLADAGVDLVDCSSAGMVPHANIPAVAGYQVPFAEAIRRAVGVPTGAVGLITEPEQAEAIVASGQADVVLLAREMLRDPYWPLRAAEALGVDVPWPKQYERAKRHHPR